MNKNRIKYIIGLILLISIPIFCVFGLAEFCYDSFENLFIDKINSIFDSNSFSRFTTLINIFGCVISLTLIPHYILKIINPNYLMPKWVLSIIKIMRRNYLLMFIFVILIIFPACLIGGMSLKESVDCCFLKENLFVHILTPLAFFFSSLTIEQNKTSKVIFYISFVPSFIYAFIYAIMVYGVDIWEDFYFIKTLETYLKVFTIPVIFILLFILNFVIGLLDNKVINCLYKNNELN